MKIKILGACTLIFLALAILTATATITDLFVTFGENYVISTIPGAGQVLQVYQIAQAVAAGPAGIASLAGSIGVGEIKGIGMNAIFGQQTANTISQIESYSKILFKDSEIKNVEIDKQSGRVKKGQIEIKTETGTPKTLELGNINEIRTSEVGIATLKIGKDGFVKIKQDSEERVYDNVNEGSVIRIDKEGNVVYADLTTTEKGSSFIFGAQKVDVPANTRVIYDDGIITVYGKNTEFDFSQKKDGEFLESSKLKILDNEVEIKDNTITGTEFKIDDLTVYNDGKVEVTDKGYLLERGDAERQGLRVEDYHGDVLFAKPDADLSSYKGNWIKQNGILEAKSFENGFLDIEIIEGNEIFDTDNNDKLRVILNTGDGIIAKSRKIEGKIPEVQYFAAGEGKSFIENGRVTFDVKKDDIIQKEAKLLRDIPSDEKYQSVPFELVTEGKYDLRVDAYNQYAILDKNNKPIVAINKFGMPVSELTKDNELQTLEQLQKKYPGINFKRPSKLEIRTDIIHAVDVYLTQNPTDVTKEIEFWPDMGNALARNGKKRNIVLGDRIMDQYADKLFEIKGRTFSQLSTIKHEETHIKDLTIFSEEFRENIGEKTKEQKLSQIYNNIVDSSFQNLKKDDNFRSVLKEIQTKSAPLAKLKISEKEIENLEEEGNKLLGSGDEVKESAALQLIEKAEELRRIDNLKKSIVAIQTYGEINPKDILNLYYSLDIPDLKYAASISTKEFKELAGKLEDAAENYGFPSLYAFTYSETMPGVFKRGYYIPNLLERGYVSVYPELSSTYMEEPVSERASKAKSANPYVSDMYRKLTQLAYDTNKISTSECAEIMGSTCQKCVEYKLLCK